MLCCVLCAVWRYVLCMAVQPWAEAQLQQAATMASEASFDQEQDVPRREVRTLVPADVGRLTVDILLAGIVIKASAAFSHQVVLKFSGEAESKRFLAARSSGFVGVVVVSTYKTAQTFLG